MLGRKCWGVGYSGPFGKRGFNYVDSEIQVNVECAINEINYYYY